MGLILHALRRLLNFLIGCGPYQLKPFHEMALENSDHLCGVERAESTTGILLFEQTHFDHFSLATVFLGDETPPTSKINGCDRYLKTGFFPQPKRSIYSLSYGGLVGNTGLIYDYHKRTAVLETAHSWELPARQHPALAAPRLPKAIELDGTCLSLVTMGAEGYYHFLHQLIPKLVFAETFINKVDHIFVNGEETNWKLNWLKKAGVSEQKLIWVNGLSHYRAKQLLFVSEVVSDHHATSWSINAIQKLFNIQTLTAGSRWIWASRSDAGSRKLNWETELLKQFPKFEPICFSELSPEQTIELCSEAAVFAGPHGAAFSNLVFCPPNTKVLEIHPQKRLDPGYLRLAELGQMVHATLITNFDKQPDIEKITNACKEFLT